MSGTVANKRFHFIKPLAVLRVNGMPKTKNCATAPAHTQTLARAAGEGNPIQLYDASRIAFGHSARLSRFSTKANNHP